MAPEQDCYSVTSLGEEQGALGGIEGGMALVLDLPIEVPPYPRVTVHLPRSRGRRAWTNNPDGLARLTAFYQELALRIPARHKRNPLAGDLAVWLWFWRRGRRCDVDNLTKSLLDGCTRAGVWTDDSQVKALSAVLVDQGRKVEPRVVIQIERLDPSHIWGRR